MGGRGLATSNAAAPPGDHGVAGAPSQDDALHRYARELTARGLAGQRALWLHLSRFEASGSRDRHVEIACKVVEELIKHFVGRMFLLESGDVVLICKDLNEKVTQDAIELLRDLFQNDPRARDGGLRFSSVFDLETDYARFAANLPPLRANAAKATARPTMRAAAPKPAARPQPARPQKARPAAARRHLRTAIVLAALALLIAGEGLLAYRSSRQPWIFDTAEALKAHQVRNPLTGEYSNRR
jgi:hypothetical protein